MVYLMKRRSSFWLATEVLEEVSQLARSNWLLNCIVLSHVCALLVSGIFTVAIIMVIRLTSLGDLGTDFDRRTSETPHHRCRRQSTLSNGSAWHRIIRRGCGDVQSLVWRYASPNCPICAPRAEGLNHKYDLGLEVPRHTPHYPR